MFVSVVSVLYRNNEFRCFDWTETEQKQPKQTEKNELVNENSTYTSKKSKSLKGQSHEKSLWDYPFF
jgi:hypothetical protein